MDDQGMGEKLRGNAILIVRPAGLGEPHLAGSFGHAWMRHENRHCQSQAPVLGA